MERYHAASVLSLTARQPVAERLDFERFIFGPALINAGSGRMSASWGEPDTPGWRE
jgi:hypothetical protein